MSNGLVTQIITGFADVHGHVQIKLTSCESTLHFDNVFPFCSRIATANKTAARDCAESTPADGLKLFQTYCFECHGDGARKGKVDLQEMLAPANLKTKSREWERAWKLVRHEFMPPVGADRPTSRESLLSGGAA